MNIFSKEKVNTGRQIEFDIAKAICIIGMVFVHTYEYFLPHDVMLVGFQNALVNVIQMLVGAPCFMICMGIGIAYTSKNSSDDLLKRGLKIFILGFVLNALREGFIYLFGSIVGLFPSEAYPFLVIDTFLNNDIMPFAGLSLMLMGLLKRFKFNDKQIMITAIILSIIGSIFRNFDVNSILNFTVGLFFGTYDNAHDIITSYFPLFNWFIFVAFGYCFGELFKRCNNKKKFYLIVSSVCAVIVTIYLLIAVPNNIGMIDPNLLNYYHLTTPETLISMMSSLVIFGIYYALSFVLPKAVTDFTSTASKNINKIYCIHWVIIGNFRAILFFIYKTVQFSQGQCVIFAISVFTISYIIAYFYDKRLKQKRAQ